jgi:hypothetical protein
MIISKGGLVCVFVKVGHVSFIVLITNKVLENQFLIHYWNIVKLGQVQVLKNLCKPAL